MTGKREYPLADVLAVLVRWAASVMNLNKYIDKNGFVIYETVFFVQFLFSFSALLANRFSIFCLYNSSVANESFVTTFFFVG